MKLKLTPLLLGGLMALGALAQPQINLTNPANPATNAEPVPPDKDKLGYAIGMNIGMNLKKQDLEVNVDQLIQAVKDALSGREFKMSDKDMNQILRVDLQGYIRAKRADDMKKLEAKGVEAKKLGEEFLAKNAKADGVQVFPDGLQYKVLQEGTGESPGSNDIVRVSYRGTLTDGTEFDKNDEFQTYVTHVIKGWTEALEKMKVGSKWTIYVPADLAYGPKAQPPKIAPNSVLVFDMQLLEVKHPPARTFPSTPGATGAPGHPITIHPSASAAGSTNGSVVSGQIIRVPSKAELDKGAKIEVIDPNSTNTAAAGK